MREIKFRGKSKTTGEWVYGTGISKIIINTYETNRYNIINNCDYDELDYFTETLYDTDEVIPETIGQFTCLKDKNGVEIYEGDIIRTYAIQGYGKKEKKVEVISEVFFYLGDRHSVDGDIINETPKFSTRQLNKQDWREVPWSMFYQCEVIGNIYENKELLGE